MKSLIGLTLALALVVSVAPVMAEDSFEGMESLNSAVVALPDAELAKVEGGQNIFEFCVGCVNVATVTQLNAAVQTQVVLGLLGATGVQIAQQDNTAVVTQDINSGAGAF